MQKHLFTLIFTLVMVAANAQTNKTFFLGHSLLNFHVPNMVQKLSDAGSNTFSYKVNIGIGANLKTHYTKAYSSQGDEWDTTLNKARFENFIITEAVPLKGHLQWSGTYQYADSLYKFAKIANPNIQYYIYETWHCKNSGKPEGCEWDGDDGINWRNRLTVDLPLWEGIADSVNLLNTKPMLVIPAGQGLARLHDSMVAGKVPGYTMAEELFTDDIHLINTGYYFVACVMYSVIHKKSPVGLPNRLTDEWGTQYDVYPTAEQAFMFQKIAWETVCDYGRDGVDCNNSSKLNKIKSPTISIVPNPAEKSFVLIGENIAKVEIFTMEGKQVYSNLQYTNEKIELANAGNYIVKIFDLNNLLIKVEKLIVE